MLFRGLVISSALLASSVASADIGFAAAVDAARAAAPLGRLFAIEQRVRGSAMVYEADLYNAELTTRYQPRLNLDTGALIRLNVNNVSAAARAALKPINDRLGSVQVDFAQAISIANEATQRSDVQKVEYDIEAGILAYQVKYFDGVTKSYIDSVTGGVVPHHMPDDDMDPTNPATSVSSAIGIAQEFKGSGWVSIGLESETEDGGNIVEVLLLDLKSGMLSVVDVSGTAVSHSVDFQPAGGQANRIGAIRSHWGMVVTDLAAAVGAAGAAYPGSGIVEAEMAIETHKNVTSMKWKINLITADLIQIDYIVDATTPLNNGFRMAMAPVTPLVGDFNRDGVVNALDLTEVFSAWGTVNPLMDINGDSMVGSHEVTAVISNWG